MKKISYSKCLLWVFVVGSMLSCTKETIIPKEVAVTGITIDKNTFSLKVGEKVLLTTTINPPNTTTIKDVIWSSEKGAVAMVSSTGEVIGLGVGEAIITATSKGDPTKKATSRVIIISRATPPSSPETLTVDKGSDLTTVVLNWASPRDTGKAVDGISVASITSYEITFTPIVNGILQPIVLDSKAKRKTLSNLTLGNSYTFTVKARNAAGLGQGKEAQIPLSFLEAPTNLTASGITTTEITLTWVAPVNKGKNSDNTPSSIQAYLLSYTGGTNSKTKKVEGTGGQAPVTSTTLKGLSSGTEYTITIKATNTAGKTSGSIDEIKAATKSIVSFDYNYTGAPLAKTQEIASGQKANEPTAPTRSGYTFKGWNSKADGSGEVFIFSVTTIKSNQTLYAKWQASSQGTTTYTVSFNYNYAGAPTGIRQSVAVGEKADKPIDHEGYKVTSWNSKADGSGANFDFETTITTDLTLYAQWLYYPLNKSDLQTLLFIKKVDPIKINTGRVTDMSELFKDKSTFNGDISTWDTSKVTTMYAMFFGASAFNGDVSKWNTSKVTTMYAMFQGASAFNGDISKWDTSEVTTMRSMFLSASAFNGDVSTWNTSKVNTMRSMFYRTSTFNGDVSTWNTSKVTNMSSMFAYNNIFNGDLSKWNTSKVTDMHAMFQGASIFNSDLSKWNTSNVTDMHAMFLGATVFNGDISAWHTSNVTTMRSMFLSTRAFNRDLTNWNVSRITEKSAVTVFSESLMANKPCQWPTAFRPLGTSCTTTEDVVTRPNSQG